MIARGCPRNSGRQEVVKVLVNVAINELIAPGSGSGSGSERPREALGVGHEYDRTDMKKDDDTMRIKIDARREDQNSTPYEDKNGTWTAINQSPDHENSNARLP